MNRATTTEACQIQGRGVNLWGNTFRRGSVLKDRKTEKIRLQVNRADTTAVLAVEGSVDMDSSPRLREALVELLQGGVPRIVVDLSRVDYMDSSGVATLVEALLEVRQRRGRLLLVSPRHAVREVFALLRLEKAFEFYPTRETALTALEGR